MKLIQNAKTYSLGSWVSFEEEWVISTLTFSLSNTFDRSCTKHHLLILHRHKGAWSNGAKMRGACDTWSYTSTLPLDSGSSIKADTLKSCDNRLGRLSFLCAYHFVSSMMTSRLQVVSRLCCRHNFTLTSTRNRDIGDVVVELHCDILL